MEMNTIVNLKKNDISEENAIELMFTDLEMDAIVDGIARRC